MMQTNIKELRARKSISQEELAKAVDVRRETINALEKGKYNPSLGLAYKIAQYFGSSIEDIFIFDEDM